MPTGRPANSWPWQNGQCATTEPNSGASPGLSGSVSVSPVASRTVREVTTSSPIVTWKPPSTAATEVAASSRTVTVSYAASSLRAAIRNSAGGVPSWVTTLCMCAAGSLR